LFDNFFLVDETFLILLEEFLLSVNFFLLFSLDDALFVRFDPLGDDLVDFVDLGLHVILKLTNQASFLLDQLILVKLLHFTLLLAEHAFDAI
jgi:hypothetical protein